MTDVLKQPDLRLSFVSVFVQYVRDLQLSLHLSLTNKHLLSGTSLQSLCSACPVWSSGADTNLHTLQSL